jgi:hypothetical protein
VTDAAQGPGWWMASDGKWYPPHLHPSAAPVASNPWAAHPFGTGPVVQPPPGHSRSKRRVIASLAVVGALVLIAGVLIGVLGGGSGEPADAAVINAVNSALGDKTAHVVVTSSTSVAGHAITFGGSGSIDFTDSAMQLTINEQQVGSIQIVYLAGVAYESLPEIGQLAPGKSWLSVDIGALAKDAGSGATSALGSDPIATLRLLALQGNTVTDLGPSTVDGQSVHGYSVALNQSAIQSGLNNANVPSWMKQAASQVTLSDGAIKVYVDSAGDLVQESTTVDATAGRIGSVNETFSIDFSAYGNPVSIAAPPASQVLPISQFLQLAGQAPTTS